MLYVWLPAYLICGLYLLAAAVWPLLPFPTAAAQKRLSDKLFRRILLQFGSLFAVVDFMLMRSLCLLSLQDQRLAVMAVMVLETAAALLVTPAVRRGLQLHTSDGETCVTEMANAKVNLTLCVGKKRPDGYHQVETVMTGVALGDTVTLERHPGIRDELICLPPVTERVEDNLCMKALRVFFAELGAREEYVTITLTKQIPTQAGLGGGSSDAAAVLRGLRRLYAPQLSDTRLEEMAAQLGSDVPYFIRGGTVLATGHGEQLTTLPPMPPCWFVVVKPEEGYATGAMYSAIDRAGAAKWMDSQAVCQALAAGNLAGVAAGLDNDFQRVLPEGSAVPEIVETLRQAGALNAQMTGSGSAVFGLFRDREAAEAAAAALQADYPRTFCVSQV